MQSGPNRPVAGARWLGAYRRCGRLCVLLLGLMVSACSSMGQIGDQLGNLNLLGSSNEATRVSVAVESVDGPPSAVHERFMRALKDEAGSRQIALVASADAGYRLRGYLAAHPEGGGTAISWAWDVYDAGQRRAFRLKGEDKSTGAAGWATADDQVLRRIAGNALDQLAGLAARPRQAAAAAPAAESALQPTAAGRSSTLGWLDDWAPEKSGIFRIFRRDEATTEVAALPDQPPPGTVPMPRGRPSSQIAPPSQALAYASAGN
ncbi:MAG: hypothetical protein AB7E84_12460 [Xanthobacteraceae bacterium]